MRLTVGVLVAIVVGLEKPTLLAQSDIYIPKCTEEGGGAPIYEIFPF